MLLELGPVEADDVQCWTRFARRMITELRTDPDDLAGIATDDLLSQWATLIDEWALVGAKQLQFRWSQRIEPERAEFLIHGLDRCLHSTGLQTRVTSAEAATHLPFTMHIVRAFVDGLSADGEAHEQYGDQLLASVGDLGHLDALG